MTEHADRDLEQLLLFIKEARGFDFTGYKRSTLTRRIRKRMADVGIDDYLDYRDLLETNADEFTSLFNTILINVTSFFRDAEAWRYLQREALPDLINQVDPSEEIRVWSAGCSSGEEPFTLAILFAEVLGLDECASRVKIYATDVDEGALHEGRAGVYPPRALEPLSPEMRDKYFETVNGKYAFRADLRRRVIFGRHDITRDAPISRLHLLVCRNTLMYFNVETQSRIIDRFNFALREGGYLFLGKAEMLLADSERFDVVNMRQRIFRRRAGAATPPHQPARMKFELATGAELREAGRHRLLRDLAVESSPNPVICVDRGGLVVLVNSQARAQFGMTTYDIGKQFRELEISYRPIELRSLIDQAYAERRSVRVSGIERRIEENEVQYFDVLVQPLWGNEPNPFGVTVTFIDTTLATRLQRELKQNRQDLETAYEELQSTNEELETTNEELQSSIEELETTNEELQSTNEELETTNEELQSGNEELETMNEELRIRTTELEETRLFLEGVLSSVAAGVVVLDSALRVRSWNRGAEELWGLRADEVLDCNFLRLDFGLPTDLFAERLQACVESGRRVGPTRIDAVNRKGRPFVCSVVCSPLERKGDGVVLLMEDVGPPGERANQSVS